MFTCLIIKCQRNNKTVSHSLDLIKCSLRYYIVKYIKRESYYKANVIARQKHCTDQSPVWKLNVERKHLGNIRSNESHLIKVLFSSNIRTRKSILKEICKW